jgi:uncharacterized secreted protein with C-terminal beta-propeller domain
MKFGGIYMKIKKIIAVVLTFVLVVSVLSACSFLPKPVSKVEGLATYKNYTDIQKLIESSLKKTNAGIFGRMFKGAMQETALNDAAGDKTGAPAQDSSLQDYSKTNLQVEGVDEADMVKTDGKYLYIIANGRFIIVDAQNPANMKIVAQIQYLYVNQPEKNTVTPIEMFLDETNQKITLITYSYDDRLAEALKAAASKTGSAASAGTVEPQKDIAIAPDYKYGYWGQQNVMVQVFDIKDITKPTLTREYLQEGTYISSRRVNEYVYVITNKYLYSYYESKDMNLLIPAIKDSAATDEWEMLPVSSLMVVENRDYGSFLVLSGINTQDNTSKPQTSAVLGAGENLYASPSNIYIASSRYTYDETADTQTKDGVTYTTEVAEETKADGNGTGTATTSSAATKTDAVAPDSTTIKEANTTTAGGTTETTASAVQDTPKDSVVTTIVKDVFQVFEPPVYKVFTDVFRFEIKDGTITPRGSGEVPGYVLNQFAMDENNGYFRIATTTGDSWREGEFTSMNNLYVLDKDLKVVGKVEGLGTRETIKSVRFLGNKAFMVTFRTTDPLFVIDLTSPTKPQVKGELKIPGYSQYLHPISDTLLLGFGKDAFEENGRAIELGFKVSLFDVADISNPKEISTFIVGDSGTYSELLNNHKALLYSKEKNIIGFPITIYKKLISQQADRFAYGMPNFTGFMILGISSENKLYEKGRISHYTIDLPVQEPTEKEYWAQYEMLYKNEYLYSVKRGMFIGDTLFTISDAFVKASSLTDFSDKGKIELPGFKEVNYYAFQEVPSYPEGKTDGSGGATEGSSGTGTKEAVDPAVKSN